MSAVADNVDIAADLHNEDDSGFVWAYLDRAQRPERVLVGDTVIAGGGGGRCLATVIDIVEGPGGQIVHLNLLPGSVTNFEKTRSRI